MRIAFFFKLLQNTYFRVNILVHVSVAACIKLVMESCYLLEWRRGKSKWWVCFQFWCSCLLFLVYKALSFHRCPTYIVFFPSYAVTMWIPQPVRKSLTCKFLVRVFYAIASILGSFYPKISCLLYFLPYFCCSLLNDGALSPHSNPIFPSFFFKVWFLGILFGKFQVIKVYPVTQFFIFLMNNHKHFFF